MQIRFSITAMYIKKSLHTDDIRRFQQFSRAKGEINTKKLHKSILILYCCDNLNTAKAFEPRDVVKYKVL